VDGWLCELWLVLTVVAGCGLHGSILHQIILVLQAGVHGAPGQRSGVHGALEASLSLRGVSFLLFHTKDKWPSSHRGVAGAYGVNVAGKLVLSAQLQSIGLTLASTVLAVE
jgi:hypothetical protein